MAASHQRPKPSGLPTVLTSLATPDFKDAAVAVPAWWAPGTGIRIVEGLHASETGYLAEEIGNLVYRSFLCSRVLTYRCLLDSGDEINLTMNEVCKVYLHV